MQVALRTAQPMEYVGNMEHGHVTPPTSFCASVGVLCPCVMCPHSPVPLMRDWLSLLLALPCLAAAAM